MRNPAFLVVVILVLTQVSFADDLYRVDLHNQQDAEKLIRTGGEALVRLVDGYLILAGTESVYRLQESGLTTTLIAAGVERDRLVIDGRLDRANAARYPVIFEVDDFRLLLVDPPNLSTAGQEFGISPLPEQPIEIFYPVTPDLRSVSAVGLVDLEWLISQIDTDSLRAYTERLQAFGPRVSGSDSNYAARDWLAAKLTSFGYDSVEIDTIMHPISYPPYYLVYANVLAYKIGTRYPDQQIIVGGHLDTVTDSPGADDDASGTAGTLEIARILRDIETELTIIFVLFDAEEQGLIGAKHYVAEAVARGDDIAHMHNLDMIAAQANSTDVKLYHGPDTTFTKVWQSLADSLLGINGHLSGLIGADHYPFQMAGFDVTFVHEYSFSTVYHDPSDSTIYLNFEYMTRLVKASLATIYMVSALAPVPIFSFDYPAGIPQYLTPGTPTVFEVDISGLEAGAPTPTSALLYCAIDDGPVTSVPLNELSPNRYEVVLPATDCFAWAKFYLGAWNAEGRVCYDPRPSTPWSIMAVSGVATIFADNFETDQGWTVSGDATSGHWVRGIPTGAGHDSLPPADYDGSGYCFLTGDPLEDTDVDGGWTYLISPVFDLAGDVGLIRYAHWYFMGFSVDDIFQVAISPDNGDTWIPLESPKPYYEDGAWYEHTFWANDFVTPTAQTRLRFAIADVFDDSFIEGGIDAVEIIAYTCEELPDWDNDGIVNDLDNCRFAANPGQEDNDTDGIGNVCDECDCTHNGDLNLDLAINPVDVVYMVNFVYKQQDAREPLETECPSENGDWNCDGQINPVDVVYYVNFVYRSIGAGPCNPCAP